MPTAVSIRPPWPAFGFFLRQIVFWRRFWCRAAAGRLRRSLVSPGSPSKHGGRARVAQRHPPMRVRTASGVQDLFGRCEGVRVARRVSICRRFCRTPRSSVAGAETRGLPFVARSRWAHCRAVRVVMSRARPFNAPRERDRDNAHVRRHRDDRQRTSIYSNPDETTWNLVLSERKRLSPAVAASSSSFCSGAGQVGATPHGPPTNRPSRDPVFCA